MGTKYLLTCECGQERTVEEKQAGEAVPCACGLPMEIPTLRQLRRLPRAVASDAAARRREKPWSLSQGLAFAGGLALAVVAAGTFALILPRRLELDTSPPQPVTITQEQLDAVTPTDSWIAWQSYLEFRLDRTALPNAIANRRRASVLNWQLVAAACGVAIGASTAVFAYVYTPAKVRQKRQR
jgi:hypothetical protein